MIRLMIIQGYFPDVIYIKRNQTGEIADALMPLWALIYERHHRAILLYGHKS